MSSILKIEVNPKNREVVVHGRYKDYVLTVDQIYNLLIEDGQMCEHCLDAGVTYENEYDRGELVGLGTIEKKCVCKLIEKDDE